MTKFLALFILIFGFLQAHADKGSDSVAGVIVFDSKVSVEKASEIAKMIAHDDANFSHVMVFGWAPDKKTEKGDNASAMAFSYIKKNDKFVKGEDVGKTIKKKVEAKYGDILRSWHISEGAVEIQ